MLPHLFICWLPSGRTRRVLVSAGCRSEEPEVMSVATEVLHPLPSPIWCGAVQPNQIAVDILKVVPVCLQPRRLSETSPAFTRSQGVVVVLQMQRLSASAPAPAHRRRRARCQPGSSAGMAL